MHRVALIYNPNSGQRPQQRSAIISQVASVFESAGVQVAVVPTTSVASVTNQARAAITQGCETIVVCGGDGTVHHVLQAVVGSSAALGVIPMGTANALAADLRLPRSPVKAAKMLLAARPVDIPAGKIFYLDQGGHACSRYFIVAAGVGADAYFFSRLDSQLKQRLGYAHYLVEALRLWATYSFPGFVASFEAPGASSLRTVEVSQLLAVRISNFGGLVRRLVPGASMHDRTLKVISFGTRSRLQYLRFMLALWVGRHTYSTTMQSTECDAVECRDLEDSLQPSFVEADGELLGTLPARIELIPNALRLLIP